MPRPKSCRQVSKKRQITCFRPEETLSACLGEMLLAIDKHEILRLAHRKVAEVLVNGKILWIEGDPVPIKAKEITRCPRCRHALGLR